VCRNDVRRQADALSPTNTKLNIFLNHVPAMRSETRKSGDLSEPFTRHEISQKRARWRDFDRVNRVVLKTSFMSVICPVPALAFAQDMEFGF